MEYRTEGSAALAPVARSPDRPAVPGELADRIQPVNLASSQRFGVSDTLHPLLPDGLPRGGIVSVASSHRSGLSRGGGATSLALALVARASQTGVWIGVLGVPRLGLVAAGELGVCLERLVLVEAGSGSDVAAVAAAMVDGFDLVVLGAQGMSRIGRRDSRRLRSRLRERSGALVCIDGDLPGEPARTQLRIANSQWSGLEEESGLGHLQARRMRVTSTGRGAASRLRQADLRLPGG